MLAGTRTGVGRAGASAPAPPARRSNPPSPLPKRTGTCTTWRGQARAGRHAHRPPQSHDLITVEQLCTGQAAAGPGRQLQPGLQGGRLAGKASALGGPCAAVAARAGRRRELPRGCLTIAQHGHQSMERIRLLRKGHAGKGGREWGKGSALYGRGACRRVQLNGLPTPPAQQPRTRGAAAPPSAALTHTRVSTTHTRTYTTCSNGRQKRGGEWACGQPHRAHDARWIRVGHDAKQKK